MKINWTQAPAWARYHAIDQNGNGYWFEDLPTISTFHSVWQTSEEGNFTASDFTLLAGQDWRQSLVERVRDETK